MAPRGTSRRWGSPVYPWHGGFSVLARAGPGAGVPEACSTAGPCTGGACSRPGLCGRRPHPSVPVPEAVVVLGSCRVTQLLEHLSEAVEQSSLFDPQHPGLEEELESLRRRLEALSSSEPSSMETHFRNPAGRLCPACPPAACAGRAGVPTCQAPGGAMARGSALPLAHITACRAGPAVMHPCVGPCHVPHSGGLL